MVRKIKKTPAEGEEQPATDTGDIQLENIENRPNADESMNATLCDQVIYGFVGIGNFIYQNSYIFTNILMMVCNFNSKL